MSLSNVSCVAGVEAVAIHGGKDQEERTRAVEAFRRGEKDVLVATDVASKGTKDNSIFFNNIILITNISSKLNWVLVLRDETVN